MIFDVIVLDSGVDILHPALSMYSDIHCEHLPRGASKPVHDSIDISGHGTAVVGLIKEQYPQASVLCLRIFDLVDGKPSSSESRLIAALKYIDEYLEAKIINISCSVDAPTLMQDMIEITKRLAAKGTVLVSAFENDGALTYPASFDWVIGVAIDSLRPASIGLVAVDDSVVNLLDSYRRMRVPWQHSKYKSIGGSSFLCAFVSAAALKYKDAGAQNIENVLDCFRWDFGVMKNEQKCVGPHMPKFKIKKAIAFPCNKEIHSVVRYAADLPFELVDIYDVKHSFRIGRSTRDVLNDDGAPEYFIKNIDAIDWDSFETLILGCIIELSELFKDVDWIRKLISEALEQGKNIYAFEDLSNITGIDIDDERVYFPAVFLHNIPSYRGGRLTRTAIPIIGVYGTSSQQGKFTIQMMLRKEFEKYDCKVGQIGTEPNALLFGMDYVFPMGYHSSIYADEDAKICYSNDLLRKVSEQNPDIILVGSQMGTVPKAFGNQMCFCTHTYAFLQGVKPDYAVVTLSLQDDDDCIRRTINFLDALTKTQTLAFVLFPLCTQNEDGEQTERKRNITNEEFEFFKTRVEKTFHIPTYLLGSETLAKELMTTLLAELEKEE